MTDLHPSVSALLFLAGVCFFFSLYLLLEKAFGIPSAAASLAVRKAGRPLRPKPSAADLWLGGLSAKLALLIERVQTDAVREKLQSALQSSGDGRTPAAYTADCAVKALLPAMLAILAAWVFPPACPFILVASVFLAVRSYRELEKKETEKRTEIEDEMPSFTAGVRAQLKHTRNVLEILDACRAHAGEALKRELDITAADMRTGSDLSALTRLETRVGSPLLTEAVRGLRAVLRGDDTEAYWEALTVRCADAQKQRLRREANRVPKKIRRLSLALLGCFLLIFLTVIGVQLFDSLGVLFG